jgi:hypothetical protein
MNLQVPSANILSRSDVVGNNQHRDDMQDDDKLP